ncbi:trans-L-3-hydroxyproline dehydratase-like [Mytilus trossulus]|uniref:trans-L-3-hydroxyproline dehydratase-like n=1 Tax=Mytilus trossulus TaxID=6551 RepID=UPI0030045664
MAEFVTTEMHTGGEPLRIIEKGYPDIPGATILEKIQTMKNSMEDKRKLLMFEPRGHFDMYGVLLVPPDIPSADVGAIFMHNQGYSTMCGHAMLALGRYIVDNGIVKNPTIPETKVNIQCPCGLVESYVKYDGKKTGAVRFFSVPAFLFAKDISVDVPSYGKITVDISYGGAFYALVALSQYKMDRNATIQKIRDAAGATTDALKKQLKLTHPDSEDLAFLYGTIVTDGKDQYSDDVSWNVCVFAEREVDRSPCGSGVTARIAQQFTRNLIKLGQTRTFEGPTSSRFTAKPVKEVTYGDYNAVIVEVSGNGYYTGTSKFTLEEDDTIGKGFLLN